MTTSLLDADSFLVIDVGSVSTRALFFDVVDGRYRYLGAGLGPTTADAPYHNISEGVRIAIDQLKKITGRELIGIDEQLLMPSSSDGMGVDDFAATLSAGSLIKIVLVGLLESVSVESARRLAVSTYGEVVDVISLNDRRKPEERIDAIMRLRPDLIIVAGGTEAGASHSVLTLLEAVGLACYLLPENQRPDVLFVGNQALQDEIMTRIGEVVNLHFAPNIRPALDVEQLDAARTKMTEVYKNIRSRQLLGVDELSNWAKDNGVLPTSAAFGRVVQFLSKEHTPNKGVLGVDAGLTSITYATAYDGKLSLDVRPRSGLSGVASEVIEPGRLDEIKRWMMIDLPEDALQEYLLQKSLYPNSLPAVPEDYAVDQALMRMNLNSAVEAAAGSYPPGFVAPGDGLLPWVEPIIATGSALIDAPSLPESVLALLDGIQPTGVTTLIYDQNHIASALGAAAASNPMLLVQVLYSNAFMHVGTIIAPVGSARPGTPILRLKITYENGSTTDMEIKQGEFEVVKLPQGQFARLQLQPLHRYDIGMGAPGRSGGLRVTGGQLGVIIDARGRPLTWPQDMQKRAELYKKWLRKLGGQ
jgi:hypothetical protein